LRLTNYLGSDNLRNQYERASVNDLGDNRGRDLMAGIVAFEKQGFIDESCIGVSGVSYGGSMTTWMTSHYHVWKAAVAAAAAINRVDVYNLADENVTERYEFGGSPWKKEYAKAYEQMSASSYMGAITTPTLKLHDTADPRVPITGSYAMYHALKDDGVPVNFIALPIAGHEPPDPVHQSDWYRLWGRMVRSIFEVASPPGCASAGPALGQITDTVAGLLTGQRP
jgi:dipeptidyl aminopeptidase/acylaminoacyl peptidase